MTETRNQEKQFLKPFQGSSPVVVECCLILVSAFRYYIMFSSVWIAEWPSFGKELLSRFTICSLCILTIYKFPFISLLGFRWLDSGFDCVSSWSLLTCYLFFSKIKICGAKIIHYITETSPYKSYLTLY